MILFSCSYVKKNERKPGVISYHPPPYPSHAKMWQSSILFLFDVIVTGLQFRLTQDKEFDEIEYSPNPRSPGSEDVLLRLPNYLQENIFFNSDQAPKFLAKLLKTAD